MTDKQKALLLQLLTVPKYTKVSTASDERFFCGFVTGGLVTYKEHLNQRMSRVCTLSEFITWSGDSAVIKEDK